MNKSKRVVGAIHFIAVLLAVLCLLPCLTAAGREERQDSAVDAPRTTLTHWHSVGGDWKEAEGGLRGSVEGTTRGFAIADDAPFAGAQTLEVLVTPQSHIGESWSAGGVCLYEHPGDYWRLALVESPEHTHYAELTLQNEGVGVGGFALPLLQFTAQPFDWKWNTPYRLRLTVAQDRITGEVFTGDGVRRWQIAYALQGTAYVKAGWPAVGVQGMDCRFGRVIQTVVTGGPEAETVRCADLEEKPARSLWLSLPNSRLVLNPNMSTVPPVPAAVAPCLPIHLAYYTGEMPVRLPYLWAWQFGPENGAPPVVTTGPSADFSPRSASLWQTSRSAVVFDGGEVRLTVGQTPFGSLSTTVTVDLDQTPLLLVRVPKSEGQWALKVNSGQQAVDTFVQADTKETGNFVYDLSAITGWHGKRTFKLILFAVGERGSTATLSGLRFAGVHGELPTPRVTETAWSPHQITAQAQTPNASVQVESRICLPDERTVAQSLRVRQTSDLPLTLTGQLPAGKARWDDTHHALIYQGKSFQMVLSVSRAARWMGLYDSSLDPLAGKPPRNDIANGGAWAIALDRVKPGEEIVVAACFGQPGESVESLLTGATKIADADGFQQALDRQEKAWNERLRRVPHPLGFALHTVAPHSVSPEAIRRTYYRAWVFLLSDSLPPLPESGFAYPQICCGKPSLWSEGASGVRATSQWESFLAMQFLAFADPALAWDAYAGQMSLVSPDGSLGGEGLPSRHAQTAWTLYSLTGNRQHLSSVYPALKRLLVWKAANPRWIYHNATPEDQKDAEFVVHALMDIEYARRIAQALGLPEEERFWQTRSARLAADFHRWFWDKEGHNYRLYRTSTGKSESPDQSWNLEGLVLPSDILQPSERDSLLHLFHASARPDIPFLIPAISVFPKYNFTLRGLWQYGKPEEVSQMSEAAMRDTTLAGEFAENYQQSFPPTTGGVLPSVFGAALIIDNVLWHNGVMCGDGLPALLQIPNARGVRNLRIRGEVLDVWIDEATKQFVLQGRGLRTLHLPAGLHAAPLPDGTPRWTGILPTETPLAPNTPPSP